MQMSFRSTIHKLSVFKFNCVIKRCINKSELCLNSRKYEQKKTIRFQTKIMTELYEHNLLSPPGCVRGLKVLDKNVFNKQIQIASLTLPKNVIVSNILPHLKPYILKMENLKPIQSDEDNRKYVLLNPLRVMKWLDLSNEIRIKLESFGLAETSFKIIDFIIGYDNFRADELLRFILPEDKDSVAGFSKIGHIIHVNLREHVLDYKQIIGEILLEKISGCRTVVNKLDKIDNTYRNFQMEILCGEKNTLVDVKENHCTFAFDFATVYWNPRLSTEHERIVQMLKSGDVLFDLFAGVGPFSIPAAKKRCFVFANDLNPESYRWLNHNLRLNKINSEYLKTFNKDARDFITTDLKSNLIQLLNNPNSGNVHITMNLPALAVEFLPIFNQLLCNSSLNPDKIVKYPTVHCYCFAKGELPVNIARDLVETNLNTKLADGTFEIFSVRKVSNYKEMMRVSFELNRDLLFGRKRNADGTCATEIKKFCHGEEQGKAEGEECFQSSRCEEFQIKNESEGC